MANRKLTQIAFICILGLLVVLLTGAASAAEWNSAAAATITLEGSTATATDGAGIEIEGSTVTITSGGTYVLSGTLMGSIVVAAPDTDDVQLVLGGVDITASVNAAIYCSTADTLTVTLAEGTVNTLTDASVFTYADEAAEEPDAALFSKVDLTISGSGQLTVNAGYNNGIGTKDDLVIEGGTIAVTAANHGIRGRDSVTVTDGNLTITSGADGIQSNNDEKEGKGWIDLSGGAFTITAGTDAVQAETSLSISGGNYALAAGGGNTATPSDTSGSYKGLKAGTDIAISGGVFTIDSADDAVHANGNIAVSGGELTLSTGDDGVHADGDLTITSGTVTILTSYEGLEAKTMTLADGVITINATDDGINISSGDDSSGMGRFGGNWTVAASSDQWLKITGGVITVVAGRDAIDVNGSGEMSGGTVNLTAATLGEGNTLDTDGGFTQTGGDLTESGGNSFGGPGGFGGRNPGGGGRP